MLRASAVDCTVWNEIMYAGMTPNEIAFGHVPGRMLAMERTPNWFTSPDLYAGSERLSQADLGGAAGCGRQASSQTLATPRHNEHGVPYDTV